MLAAHIEGNLLGMATEETAGAGQSSGASGGGGSGWGGGSGGVDRGTEDRVSAAMEQARSSRSDSDDNDGGRGAGASSSSSSASPGAGEGSMDAAAGAQGAGRDEAAERAQTDRRTEARRDADRRDAVAAEARASQERLAAQGQAARRSYEAREAARATVAAGPAEVAPAEVAAPRTAAPGTYEDSDLAQTMSGVNEGIATLAGGAVDLSEMALNGALWVGEKAGVPGADFRFQGSFGGSGTFETAMEWTGSINPESADPTKQAVRDRAQVTAEIAGAATGAALAARGVSAGQALDDVVRDVAGMAGRRRGVSPRNPLDDAQIDAILATPKGQRPDPSTYMTQAQIDAHLARFDDGAARLTTQANIDRFGVPGGPGGFTTSTAEMKDAIVEARRSFDTLDERVAYMEQRLGYDPGGIDIDTAVVARMQPDPLRDRGLRVPSGNEAGANDNWVPGGFTSGDIAEAVVDHYRDVDFQKTALRDLLDD